MLDADGAPSGDSGVVVSEFRESSNTQWAHDSELLVEAFGAARVGLFTDALEPMLKRCDGLEVTMAAEEEVLLNTVFEGTVGRLNVAVLLFLADARRSGLHTEMAHESCIVSARVVF